MKSDLISIIIPVYNVEKYLNKCIESVVKQTYKNLEIILIDDGSTDNSGKICDEWKEKDNRVIVVHKENGGVSSARNIGLDIAKGEYIGFVDPDDIINKRMYEYMYDEIKENEVDLVLCNFKKFFDNNILEFKYDKRISKKMIREYVLKMIFPYRGYIWQGLFKKKLIGNLKFDINIYIAEDLKFLCEYIVKNVNNCRLIENYLYYYRQRSNENIIERKSVDRIIHRIESIEVSQKIVINSCDNKMFIYANKSLISYYWIILYELLLLEEYRVSDKYYNILLTYKEYFSIKDKVYIVMYKLNPKLYKKVFEFVKKIKVMKKH